MKTYLKNIIEPGYGSIHLKKQWLFLVFLLISLLVSVNGLSSERSTTTPTNQNHGAAIPTIPGASPVEIALRDARKKEMLQQRVLKGNIVTPQLLPEKDTLSTSQPLLSSPQYNDYLPLFTNSRSDLNFEKAVSKIENTNLISPQQSVLPSNTILLGPARIAKKTATSAHKLYSWLETKVSYTRKLSEDTVLRVDPEKINKSAQNTLQKLSEIEGVSVSIPGVEYALTPQKEVAPAEYEVEDKLFTIDGISLEKTTRGDFVSRIPQEAKDALEMKTLCFSSEKDKSGKTIAAKIDEGCAETLAKVLAKWARYSEMGFNFEKNTEEKVVKAIIKFVGIGMDDGFIRLEESEVSSGILEREIKKVVGDDRETMLRIARYIYPKGDARRKQMGD